MIVDVDYYKLKETKFMNDNHSIECGQELLKTHIKEDGFILFETFDNSPIKRIFWAKKEEVEFINTKQEDWSEEKIKKREKELLENLM